MDAEKRFSCYSRSGSLRFNCHEAEVGDFVDKDTAMRILALKVNQTLTDSDGDEWGRIA